MTLIECSDLQMQYDGKVVLSDLSFEVYEGDYLCIVGENGSGKTTLISGMLGLNKVKKGSINFCSGLTKSTIGYLPQHTQIDNDFPASVYEIVLSGCLGSKGVFSFYTKEDKQNADKFIKLLEIKDIKQKAYSELSGGQQQRVLLARALCSAKKVLILDEPASGLDPIVTNAMYDILAKLNKEQNLTIIMVSHDILASVKYANRILHLEKTPLFFGSKDDYLKTDIAKRLIGGECND